LAAGSDVGNRWTKKIETDEISIARRSSTNSTIEVYNKDPSSKKVNRPLDWQ
jgi:hypothetical protein